MIEAIQTLVYELKVGVSTNVYDAIYSMVVSVIGHKAANYMQHNVDKIGDTFYVSDSIDVESLFADIMSFWGEDE